MIWNLSFQKIVNVIYKKHFEVIKLMLLFSLIAQRPIVNIYQNPRYSLIIRVHEGQKPMAIYVRRVGGPNSMYWAGGSVRGRLVVRGRVIEVDINK